MAITICIWLNQDSRSGGAIWNNRNELSMGNEFVVANGDAVMLMNRANVLNDMLDYHRKSKLLATLLVCDHPNVGQTIPGVWVDDYNGVVQFGKGPSTVKTCVHYTGIALFSDEVLNLLPDGSSNILYDILLPAIQNGATVNIWKEPMHWFETGSATEFLSASNRCLDMLVTSESAQWYLIDILDRFTPGWRDFSDHGLFTKKFPDVSIFCRSGQDRFTW